jgi:hypothetical protein
MKISPLKSFLIVSSALTLIALGCSFFGAYVLHWGSPYNSVLPPEKRAFDLMFYRAPFSLLHRYEFMPLSGRATYRYPAPVAWIYCAYFAFPHPAFMFQATIVLTMVVGALLLGRNMISQGFSKVATIWFVGISACLSYPFWFEVHQANTELFIFIFLAIAICCFLRGAMTLAAICIGVVTAMKIYPLIFLGLFLSHRQYRPITIALIVAGMLTIGSLAFLTPSISYSWHGISYGLNDYSIHVVQDLVPDAIGYDHSFFTVIKTLVGRILGRPDRIGLALHLYLAVAVVGGLALYFFRIRFLPVISQVFCFTLACTFLTPSSFDYTLLALYIPWAMLVIYAVRLEGAPRHLPGLLAAFIGLALLIGADTELIAGHHRFGGQIKALVFPLVFFVALRYPFGETEENATRIRPSLAAE